MAGMNQQDEAFFEQLAGAKEHADESYGNNADGGTETAEAPDSGIGNTSYEIELARARAGGAVATAGTAHPRLKAKPAVSVDAEDDPSEESAWSDSEPEGRLTVDVYQTPNDMVVETAIAGVRPEDIDVHATTDSVTIRGSRARQKPVRDDDYLYQECYWGRFARTVILPQEVDPDAASVSFRNGILTVKLPKANRKKTKKLRIVVE